MLGPGWGDSLERCGAQTYGQRHPLEKDCSDKDGLDTNEFTLAIANITTVQEHAAAGSLE